MNYKVFTTLNDDIIKIRTLVFVEEQGFKNEFDETDKTCFHIVLYNGKNPVAVCRYFKNGENYQIGRVAVVKEHRREHLGYKIMEIAENEIRKEGGRYIEVSAQVQVSDFYKKLGYNQTGKIYFDEHCEHIKMIKEL